MMRRRWLVTAAGGAAAAAGVGWKAWSDHRVDAETGGLWRMQFDKPDGGRLVMASLRGRPLLLNFWATWCAPCVKEMPLLDRFARDFAQRDGRVVGLAVDRAGPVQEFLRQTPVGFSVGLAGFDGVELTQKLGNPNGALPFTVLFSRDGRVAQRQLGETMPKLLADWLKSL